MHKTVFGTDGIRALVGKPPFDYHSLHTLGYALGQWMVTTYGPEAQILVGYDTRTSADWVKSTLNSGLLLHPLTIHDAGIMPTPAASVIMKQYPHINCSIIISASHNPHQYNGLKIIDAKQGKLTPEMELEISAIYHQHLNASGATYETPGSVEQFPYADTLYMQAMTDKLPEEFLGGTTIVLDCAHGATSHIAPAIFEQCGAEVITLNNEPNGTNINEQCGSLHPNVIQQAVRNHQADMGFAFDGDGDRIIAVNNHGKLKDGDDILALLATHPEYSETETIVGTIMSNEGLAQWCANNNKKFMRTPVGDKHIGYALQKHNLILGGEPSGHIVLNDHCTISDGIFCALRIAQTVLLNNNLEMETFDKMPHAHITVPVTQKKDLTVGTCHKIIEQTEKKLDTGRVVVRYSGTEDILRILTEAPTETEAQDVAHNLAQELQKELGS